MLRVKNRGSGVCWAEGAAVDGRANVPRPAASASIWQNPSPCYATHRIALGGNRRWFALVAHQPCLNDQADGALSAAARIDT